MITGKCLQGRKLTYIDFSLMLWPIIALKLRKELRESNYVVFDAYDKKRGLHLSMDIKKQRTLKYSHGIL